MFAHDLITDLSFVDTDKTHSHFGLGSEYIENIKNSFHFFLGDSKEILSFAKRKEYKGQRPFSGLLGYDVKMPFPKCLFFFQSPKGVKVALYAEEFDTGDKINLYCFIKKSRATGWGVPCHKITISYLLNPEDKSLFDIEYLPDSGFGRDRDHAEFMYSQVWILNFTLMLLNTKNIIHKKNKPPEKLNKKRVQKNKPPLFSYHTLEVVKPGQQTVSEGWDSPGNTMRLHFCRGHFRYYTKEKPLFGRLVGRFWIQPHLRGSKNKGMVAKDYNVKIG